MNLPAPARLGAAGRYRTFAGLRPYLGASGHPVALRAGDLAYLEEAS